MRWTEAKRTVLGARPDDAAADTETDEGHGKAGLWESFSIMVRFCHARMGMQDSRNEGVDALNTTLEVFLFAAAMNLGQSWNTVLTLCACQ